MVYNVYCVKTFEECKYKWLFKKDLFKEMTIFAGWNMWGNLAYVCYTQGLNMMLNVFFGPVVNAARGVAVQVQGTVGNFANNFQMAINPQITKTYASGKLKDTHQLIYRGSRLTFCLMLILCLPLIVETPMILSVWLKEVPEGSVVFLRLLLVIVLVQKCTSPLATAVSSTGQIKRYETMVNGLMLLILPTAYFVLKYGGAPWTVFVVYLIIAILSFVVNLCIALPMMELSLTDYVRYAIKPCMVVMLLSMVVPVIMYFLATPSMGASLLNITLTVIATTTISFIFGLDAEERSLFTSKIAKITRKEG
jgi:O-antigen/teichoic acid export membrane protein